jgi:hypothetical protein
MSNYFDNKTLFNEPIVKQYNNHMVMTNVAKETKHKLINIDTKFCDEYVQNRTNAPVVTEYNPNRSTYNISKYIFTLPERLTEVKSMMVCNVELPMTIYNVSSALGNNYFRIFNDTFEDPFSAMIFIPDGFYTVNTLRDAINYSLLENNYQGYYLVYNVVNGRSAFSISEGSGVFNIEFAVSEDGAFDKYNFKSKLGWLLGYRDIQYAVDSGVGERLSDAIVDLSGPKYLYLSIDEYTNCTQPSFIVPTSCSVMYKNIIAKVIMNKQMYPFGTVMPANNFDGYLMTDKRTYTGKVDIQKLQIQLLDEYGNPVNLNGADFSFCLQIEHE